MILNNIFWFALGSASSSVIAMLVTSAWSNRRALWGLVRGVPLNKHLEGVWYEYHITRQRTVPLWIEYESKWNVSRFGSITAEMDDGENPYRGSVTVEGTDLVVKLNNVKMPERPAYGRIFDTIQREKLGVMVFADHDNQVSVSPYIVTKNGPLTDQQIADLSRLLEHRFLNNCTRIKRHGSVTPTPLGQAGTAETTENRAV